MGLLRVRTWSSRWKQVETTPGRALSCPTGGLAVPRELHVAAAVAV